MDVQRAKEIVNSTDSIEVHLNGQSVWIDSVDATAQTATVHTQGSNTQSKSVRVQELTEIH
jgi:small acid-soluble spore protein H (minor)